MSQKNSFYRKYRPKNFSEVVGHENVVNILKNMFINNKVPHALLLTGQRGTGKTSIAKIVAKTLNCEKIVGYQACDNCQNCLESTKNSNPDIYEMDAASNNGVDEIRNITNNVSTLPVLGKNKVYIIDEVHMLTNSAFNALLKTLEEPPQYVFFILATTEYNKIPATILSRCQIFSFKKITEKPLIKKLSLIAEQEKMIINQEVLEEIFYLSDGSLRDALNYLEQLSLLNRETITVADFKNNFSSATKLEKLLLINNVLTGNSRNIIKYFEVAKNNGLDFDVLSLGLLDLLKEIIEYKLTNDGDFLDKLTLKDLEEFQLIDVNKLFLLADKITESYSKTKGININSNYLLISLLSSLSEINENVSRETQIHNIETQVKKESAFDNEINATLQESAVVDELQTTKMPSNLVTPNDHQLLNETTTINQTSPMQEVSISSEKTIEKAMVDFNNEQNLENSSKISFSDLPKYKYKMIVKDNVATLDNIYFDEDEIINILQGAQKQSRLELEEKLEEIFEKDEQGYLINPDLVLKLLIFTNIKLPAVTENSALFVTEDLLEANLINHKMQDEKFRNFIFDSLSRYFAIYAIPKSMWEKVKLEYKNLKDSNDLPNYEKIDESEFYKVISKRLNQDITKDEKYNEGKKIFGEDLIEIID